MLNGMLRSKKERAFYFIGFLTLAYVGLRFFNGALSSFDLSFGTIISVLSAFYIGGQSLHDYKHGDHTMREEEKK